MELNEEIEPKFKKFHELELDDRILKVKLIYHNLIKRCYVVYLVQIFDKYEGDGLTDFDEIRLILYEIN